MLKRIARKYVPCVVRDLVSAIRMHRETHGEYPRLIRPRTVNERLLRRKLFDRRPLLSQLTDKYSVRHYVAQRVGPDVLPKLRRPENLELMVQTAQELAADLDFVRVDLYDIGSRIYFGEMTFTPGAGLARIEPRAMDEHLGDLWACRAPPDGVDSVRPLTHST